MSHCHVTVEDVENRFSFHPVDSENRKVAHETVRETLRTVALSFLPLLPDCAEKCHAIDALDSAQQWANAAIARHWEGG